MRGLNLKKIPSSCGGFVLFRLSLTFFSLEGKWHSVAQREPKMKVLLRFIHEFQSGAFSLIWNQTYSGYFSHTILGFELDASWCPLKFLSVPGCLGEQSSKALRSQAGAGCRQLGLRCTFTTVSHPLRLRKDPKSGALFFVWKIEPGELKLRLRTVAHLHHCATWRQGMWCSNSMLLCSV